MFKRYAIILLGMAALGCAPPARDPHSPAVSGEILFRAKQCYTCHTIGRGVLVGPDLKGLFERRSVEWVRRYIADPVTMTATDPVAIELKKIYKVQMPRLVLSPADMDQLILYLQSATR